MKKYSLILLLALTLMGQSTLDTIVPIKPDTLPVTYSFADGNKYYSEGSFDLAEQAYLAVLKENGSSSTLLYNLSNSVYRQHRLGEAILLLERAKLLAPKDEDINHNLNFLATQTVDAIVPLEKGPVVAFLLKAHTFLSLKKQVLIASALSFIFMLLLFIALYKEYHRTLVIYLLLITFSLVLLTGLSVGKKVYDQENLHYGIILTDAVDAMNEPRGATLIFSVHEGAKCQILKNRDNWLFIELLSGATGWIPQESLGVIE